MSRDKDRDVGQHKSTKGYQPLLVVLITIYLVFAVALAHTAYVALQGRNTAAEGLAAMSQSLAAFSDLKQQIVELKTQLAEAHQGVDYSTKQTSSELQQQLQQLKQDLARELARPLQNTTQAAVSLLDHAAKVDKRFMELQDYVSSIDSKIAAPPSAPPAAPGARVEDKELQHIASHQAVCDKSGASGITLNVTNDLIAPLVIVGHNRPGYLTKAMMTLLKYWTADPSYARKFPLFISIDGQDQRTLLVASALHQAVGTQIITRKREGGPQCPQADCHISQHYKLLLQLFLQCLKAPGLLFLEEDLLVAPDFLSYFERTAPLMARDSSIYCVSAWNDHGQRGRARDKRALYRTDVMPGLGWYLNAAIGLELVPKWPLTNWDDWMRLPGIKNGRSCIYPEVSRTHTFGREGTHPLGDHFDHHYASMLLNDEPINWSKMDVEYLLADNYTRLFDSWLNKAEVFNGTLDQLEAYCMVDKPDDTERTGDLVYWYPAGKTGWETTAARLRPMLGDMREGTPRCSYKGHAVVRCRGRRLLLRAV